MGGTYALFKSFCREMCELDLGVKCLDHKERDDLQVFLGLFDDFFLLCEGVKGLSEDLLTACPPSKNLAQDKLVLGVYKAQELIGLIDLIQDYPERGTWTIGYLLVHPQYRLFGYGQRLVEKLAAVLLENGATKMRCIVQEQNPRALRFWQKCGFGIVRKTQTTSGVLMSVISVLEVELHSFVSRLKT